jgi:cytochrome c biogenesis protein ResB
VLILYLSCTACTSWRPDSLSPQAVVQGPPQPLSLRVTYKDSSWVILNNPVLQGDTIVGRDKQNAQVRVPLDSVLLTDTRHGDAGKSVLAFLGVTAAVLAVAAVAFTISCNQSNCFDMQRY